MICTLQVPNIIYKSERYLCDMNIKCRWIYTHSKTSEYQQSNSIQHNSNSAIVGRIRLKRTLRFYFYCHSTGGGTLKYLVNHPINLLVCIRVCVLCWKERKKHRKLDRSHKIGYKTCHLVQFMNYLTTIRTIFARRCDFWIFGLRNF